MADGKVKEPEHAKIDEIVEEDDEFEEFEDEVRSAPDAQLLLYTQESQPRREMRGLRAWAGGRGWCFHP